MLNYKRADFFFLRRAVNVARWFALGLSGLCLLASCRALFPTESGPANTNAPAHTAATPSNNMPNPATTSGAAKPFYQALNASLAARGQKLETLCPTDNPVAKRVLEEYGALFMAGEQVKTPPVCVFTSENEVQSFQQEAGIQSGVGVELQPAAMSALLEARAEAAQKGLSITPRGGAEAGRRDYETTVRLWKSRFEPGLAHWQSAGRLPADYAARLRQAPLTEQVKTVLELEKQGLYFSKDFSKSVLYSVAAPGTSQHLSMLALDVTEYGNAQVRAILARHGWFQTVQSDLPHFTYLGVEESELPARGLRQVQSGSQTFWIPNANQ